MKNYSVRQGMCAPRRYRTARFIFPITSYADQDWKARRSESGGQKAEDEGPKAEGGKQKAEPLDITKPPKKSLFSRFLDSLIRKFD